MLTWISQSQYTHETSPLLSNCKKREYWVIWKLNSNVNDVNATLIPNSTRTSSKCLNLVKSKQIDTMANESMG